MAHPLDQLYKAKLQLIALLSVVGGVALLVLARWTTTEASSSWLTSLPVSEIGSTLFGTGLLAIFFEYVDRKHGDQRTDQRVQQAVRHEAPAIRDAVLDSFAFDPDTLRNVASTGTLDRIATNALGLRLGDQQLAGEVYADLRDQVIRAPERWHDVDVAVNLSLWKQGPLRGRGSMFEATVRWEYRVTPASSTMRFACVSDLAEYRDMLRDQSVTSAWHFDPSGGIDAASVAVFELLQLTVDGTPKSIRRTTRDNAQLYSVSLGKDATTNEVTVAYTYRVLVQRHGHLLYLDLPRPTKGLHVRLDYAAAGIRRVNTLDYFAGTEQARIDQTSVDTSAKAVDVGFDGWIFPRSGVAFVWVLDEELPRNKQG